MTITQLLTLGLLTGFTANATPITFQSGVEQTSLLELYTSEGCSSCPPAETWFSKLKDSSGLWKDFVPVAFHVDYWNNLGWRDPWSDVLFSDRQRDYAAAWGSSSIYTPGFVLNGKEWRNWFGLKGSPSPSGEKAGVLMVTSTNNLRWQVEFAPVTPANNGYEVHAAVLASGLTSDVKAGENRGRKLNHDFVVISLTDGPLAGKDGKFQAQLLLDTSSKVSKERLALAVWVTERRNLKPVQAVGGWLAGTERN